MSFPAPDRDPLPKEFYDDLAAAAENNRRELLGEQTDAAHDETGDDR